MGMEGEERSVGMDQLDEWKWSDRNGLDRCERKDVNSMGEIQAWNQWIG